MPDGAELSIPVNVITGNRRRPRLVAVAGHHGDEQEGPAALITLWRQLRPEDMTGSIVIVPVLNPPAFRAVRRTSYEDGVDINRIFPGNSNGTVTERLADAFCSQVAADSDLILSMHGWSVGYGVEPYVEYPASGAVSGASGDAARAFGLGFVNPLEAGPGRLVTEASRMGLPVIEVEIGGQGTTEPRRRALYETGTRNLLRHLGITRGRASAVRPRTRPKAIDRVEVFAPTGGLLQMDAPIGKAVRKGQALATIYGLDLEPVASVASPVAGIVGISRMVASVLPGQLLGTIFTPYEGGPLRD